MYRSIIKPSRIKPKEVIVVKTENRIITNEEELI